jgi:hypothetical protein
MADKFNNLTASSQSSALSPLKQGPDLASLLGNAITGPLGEAKGIEQQIGAMQGAQGPGLLEQLFSPKGLGLLGGALMAGKQGGAGAAGAFGLGGIQGIQSLIAQEKEQQAAAIASLQEQRDKALDRADKAIQRVSTAFNTNPDAFINPETGEPVLSPREIGFLATGTDIEMFPQTRRLMEQRDEQWKRRMDLLTGALKSTRSLEDARNLTEVVMRNMNWTDPDPATVDALARSMGTERFPIEAANAILKAGHSSGLAAIVYGLENGLAWDDPEVWRRVDFNEETATDPQNIQDQLYADALFAMNDYERANPEEVFQMRRESGEDNSKYLTQLSEKALAQQAGTRSLFQRKMGLLGDDTVDNLMRSLGVIRDNNSLAIKLGGIDKLPVMRGMTDEQRQQFELDQANHLAGATQRAATNSKAESDAALMNDAVVKFQQQIKLSPQAAHELASRAFIEAAKPYIDKSGRITNEAAFIEAYNKLVQEQIQLIKQKRGE